MIIPHYYISGIKREFQLVSLNNIIFLEIWLTYPYILSQKNYLLHFFFLIFISHLFRCRPTSNPNYLMTSSANQLSTGLCAFPSIINHLLLSPRFPPQLSSFNRSQIMKLSSRPPPPPPPPPLIYTKAFPFIESYVEFLCFLDLCGLGKMNQKGWNNSTRT